MRTYTQPAQGPCSGGKKAPLSLQQHPDLGSLNPVWTQGPVAKLLLTAMGPICVCPLTCADWTFPMSSSPVAQGLACPSFSSGSPLLHLSVRVPLPPRGSAVVSLPGEGTGGSKGCWRGGQADTSPLEPCVPHSAQPGLGANPHTAEILSQH